MSRLASRRAIAEQLFRASPPEQQRAELQGLSLVPKIRGSEERYAPSLGTEDRNKIRALYLAAIHALRPEHRTVDAIAKKLRIAPLCVRSYLFANPDVAQLVVPKGQ